MQRPEVANRAVLGEVASAQHPKRQILVQLTFDLAQTEDLGGVAEDHHPEHHRRLEHRIARTAACLAGVERAPVQRIDNVANEVGQMSLGQPILK